MFRFTTLFSLPTVITLLTPTAITQASEISGDVFIANNYIFRGLTRTKDQATVQGGVHYQHDIGFYAGLQVSNVDFRPGAGPQGAPLYADSETIYTAGYSAQFNEINYLVGLTVYEYPSGGGPRFHEFNADIGYRGYELSLNYDEEHENLYTRLSYQADINERMSWLAHLGHYSLDDPSALTFRPVPLFDDYIDILVGFRYRMESGFTWGINYVDTDLSTDDTDEYGRFVISLEKSFEFI